MKNIEVIRPVEIRKTSDSKINIRGLLPTKSPSEVMFSKKKDIYFKEIIMPYAFKKATDKKIPLLLINHDYSKQLDVLEFNAKETKKGFEFSAIVNMDNISEELLIKSDKIQSLSFGFRVGEDVWNGDYRLIYSFEELMEISILKGKRPCYSASEVVIKSKNEEFKTTEDIRRWLYKKKLDVLRQELEDLKKVSR